MNAVDIALVVVMLGFAVYGLMRGLVFELLMLFGFVAAYVIAVMHMSALAAWMNKLVGLPLWIAVVIGFLILFVFSLLICRILAGALRHLFTKTPAAWLDRIGGGIFGLAKGVLAASLLAIAVSFSGLPHKVEAVRTQSKLFNPVRRVAPAVFNFVTRSFPKTRTFADEVLDAVPGFAKPDSVNTIAKRIEKFQRELTSGRDELEKLQKEVREHADKP